jgi:hypothetical protein
MSDNVLDVMQRMVFAGIYDVEDLELFRECAPTCDDDLDDGWGCGGCACHISAPCAHCRRVAGHHHRIAEDPGYAAEWGTS